MTNEEMRITPAWAGKRMSVSTEKSAAQDHPRVGGEKLRLPWYVSSYLGSPPRGRGKVETVVGGGQGEGITPAWAGKRPFRTPPTSL